MEESRVARGRQRAREERRRLLRIAVATFTIVVLAGAALPFVLDDRQSSAQPSELVALAEAEETADQDASGDNPLGDLIDLGEIELSSFAPPTEPIALAVLSMPKLGTSAPVYDAHYPSVLERGIGQWPGTTQIGEPGNAVLLGHRTTYTAPFNRLDELAAGDEILLNVFGRGEVVFLVYDSEIVPEADYAERVLEPAPPGERIITLLACHPKGSRSHRIVVWARATEPPPPDAPADGDDGPPPA